MAKQLIFTSVSRGLDAGKSGYCTVARHRDLRERLVPLIERISTYQHLNLPVAGHPTNPVVCSHRIISLAGVNYHVLSRIVDAGLDYSRRSNYLAHHLILDEKEIENAPQPAEILLGWTGWLDSWSEGPRYFGPEDEVDVSRLATRLAPALPAQTWQALAGHSACAATLAELGPENRAGLLISPGLEKSLIGLFRESAALLSAYERWNLTFSTFLQATDVPTDFRWFGCWLTRQVESGSSTRWLDLTRPGQIPAPTSALAQRASYIPPKPVAQKLSPAQVSPLEAISPGVSTIPTFSINSPTGKAATTVTSQGKSKDTVIVFDAVVPAWKRYLLPLVALLVLVLGVGGWSLYNFKNAQQLSMDLEDAKDKKNVNSFIAIFEQIKAKNDNLISKVFYEELLNKAKASCKEFINVKIGEIKPENTVVDASLHDINSLLVYLSINEREQLLNSNSKNSIDLIYLALANKSEMTLRESLDEYYKNNKKPEPSQKQSNVAASSASSKADNKPDLEENPIKGKLDKTAKTNSTKPELPPASNLLFKNKVFLSELEIKGTTMFTKFNDKISEENVKSISEVNIKWINSINQVKEFKFRMSNDNKILKDENDDINKLEVDYKNNTFTFRLGQTKDDFKTDKQINKITLDFKITNQPDVSLIAAQSGYLRNSTSANPRTPILRDKILISDNWTFPSDINLSEIDGTPYLCFPEIKITPKTKEAKEIWAKFETDKNTYLHAYKIANKNKSWIAEFDSSSIYTALQDEPKFKEYNSNNKKLEDLNSEINKIMNKEKFNKLGINDPINSSNDLEKILTEVLKKIDEKLPEFKTNDDKTTKKIDNKITDLKNASEKNKHPINLEKLEYIRDEYIKDKKYQDKVKTWKEDIDSIKIKNKERTELENNQRGIKDTHGNVQYDINLLDEYNLLNFKIYNKDKEKEKRMTQLYIKVGNDYFFLANVTTK